MRTFDGAMAKVVPDGKVPVVDAGLFTRCFTKSR